MNLKQQQEKAREKGWARLGLKECQIDVPLTDREKIDLGKSIAESKVCIDNLQDELAEIKGEFKNKIEGHAIILKQGSEMLKAGKRPVKKKLPCFFDARTKERHYVDMDTGEIVLTVEAQEGDQQGNLIEEDV